MGEKLQDIKTPQQRVFGDIYQLPRPKYINDEAFLAFYNERLETIMNGETCWLPIALDDPVDGFDLSTLKTNEGNLAVAHLYKNQRIVATVEFNHSTRLTDLYLHNAHDLSELDMTIIGSEMSFDDAVIEAEHIATMTDNHPVLFELNSL